VIEGTDAGRTHIFIRSNSPQIMKYVEVRLVGIKNKLGRYPIHFHHNFDGSRGSVLEGVVVHGGMNHAFAVHESHGVTLKDCVAYNTYLDPFWWDFGTDTLGLVYDHCLAAGAWVDTAADVVFQYQLTGFFLGMADGNVVRDCAATGIGGSVNSSGFKWGENDEGVWVVQNCVSHNNAVHGFWVWQVTTKVHLITDPVAYNNGGSGIYNGAYNQNYQWVRGVLVGNAIDPQGRVANQALGWAASSSPSLTTRQRFENLKMDAAGTPFAMRATGSTISPDIFPAGNTSVVQNCTLSGASRACISITFDFHDFGPYACRWDFVNNTYNGNAFWFDDTSHPGTIVHVDDPVNGRITLRHRNTAGGYLNNAWNAKVFAGWV
jgi:hypothetical protein